MQQAREGSRTRRVLQLQTVIQLCTARQQEIVHDMKKMLLQVRNPAKLS
jgi:hypothetical protein